MSKRHHSALQDVGFNRLTGKTYTNSSSCGMANGQVAYYYNNLLRLDDFNNNQLPAGWTKSATDVTFSSGQMHITGPGAWTVYASHTEGVGDGTGAQFTFKISSASAVATIYLDSGS